jgi:hypothetical protein
LLIIINWRHHIHLLVNKITHKVAIARLLPGDLYKQASGLLRQYADCSRHSLRIERLRSD